MSRTILCLNPGSSSLKYASYRVADDGEIFETSSANEQKLDSQDLASFRDAVGSALDEHDPDAIGYRLVHGGSEFLSPTRLDDTTLAQLRTLQPLAPDHLPSAFACIDAARERLPEVSHIACFDTAFHQGMPDLAKHLPLPAAYFDQGIRRYGFHGLSFEFIVTELGTDLPDKTIIAHLGNGSSLVALWRGDPIETTMGMTPSGGMIMGSRSGDIDPGVLVHLLREKDVDAEEFDRLINQQSGLRGISELSSDMRTLLDRRHHHPQADLAIQMYCHSARKHIGALAATLGGLDLLVFTGGIGENSEPIREEILAGLAFLDAETRVVRTDETLTVARHLAALEHF